MEVSKKTTAKIGLFGAITIILGGMIGIGIFFKNGGIFAANNANTIGVLMSWIVASLIAFATAFSYTEIITCKTRVSNAGLAGWAEQFCGHKISRGVKIWQPMFYFPMYVFVIAIFASEAMFNCFMTDPGTIDLGNMTMLYIMLGGLGLIILFVGMNYMSTKVSSNFSKYTTIIKFLPLVAVVVLGVAFGTINGGGIWNNMIFIHYGGMNQYVPIGPGNPAYSGQFSINGVFMSIPAILFAFDSFLIIGNISSDIKNPSKNVPLSMVIAMIVTIFIYIVFSIAQITIGTGNPYVIMEIVASGNETLKIALNITMSIFILIAILGVLNAITMAGVRSMTACVNDEVAFASKTFKKVKSSNPLTSGTLYLLVLVFILFIGVGLPSVIMNTDQIVDGFSNLAVLFFFLIYGTIILGGLINRHTNKVEVRKVKGFVTVGIIAVVGCFFAFAYCAFYQFFIAIILEPNGLSVLGTRTHASINTWGLFLKSNFVLANWQVAIVFWSAALFFFALPFINDGLIKKFDKQNNQPLIWEKYRKIETGF